MRIARAAIGMSLLLTACAWSPPPAAQPDDDHVTVTLRGPEGQSVTVRAELADEPAEWERGLMGRAELPDGSGMLFIFPEERERTFWMKDTLVPLDVIFFSASGWFVSIATMQPCAADPCPTYLSAAPASMALEVSAGAAESWGVGEGWGIQLEGGGR